MSFLYFLILVLKILVKNIFPTLALVLPPRQQQQLQQQQHENEQLKNQTS